MFPSGRGPQGHLYTSEDCRRQWHCVGQSAHQYLSPKPRLETGTACSMQDWLAKAVQAAGSVAVGKVANAEGGRKDVISLLWHSLTLRSPRQFSQNPAALYACRSLPAFFHFPFQRLMLDRLFYKKENLHSASTAFLMNTLLCPNPFEPPLF